jgi:MFS family permease
MMPLVEPLPYHSAVPLPFVDRSPRLIALGVILIVGACLSGCLVAALPLALYMPQGPDQPEMHVSQLITAGLMYGLAALLLGVLGYGLTRRRRWARPLTLIFAAHALVLGSITFLGSLIMIPLTSEMMQQAAIPQGQTGGMNGGMFVLIILAFMILFLAVLGIALPLTFFILLRHPEVRATVEHYDPKQRWTDRMPQSVLGMMLTLTATALLIAFGALNATIPLFNRVIHGPVAVMIVLLTAALVGVATVQVYRLRPNGWWLGVLTVTLATLLLLPSIFLMPLADYYAALGADPRQIEPVLAHATLARASTAGMLLLVTLAFVVYMWRTKPAFDAAVRDERVL